MFFNVSGICQAVLVADMDMIRGHSDLLLGRYIVVDNPDTQQSKVEERWDMRDGRFGW